jgi:hypothetical protein
MRKKIHPRLTFAREGGGGAREMEDRVAPLKREEDLAREVKEAEIHLRLAFAHEGGGKRETVAKRYSSQRLQGA